MALEAVESVVGEVVEEVADNLDGLASATRAINPGSVSFLLTGLVIGASVGFYLGHRWKRDKIRTEAYEESEKEVATLREIYRERAERAEQAVVSAVVDKPLTDKPSVESIVAERGYSKRAVEDKHDRPLPAPVPITEPYTGKSKDRDWDYTYEIASRTPEAPYVIHQDEFNEADSEYQKTTYTFYAKDGVLVDVDDRPLPHADIVVGTDNLKWGHGSDDTDVVFVRNERLELDMEICRSADSYEEEVLGLTDDVEN